MKIEIQDIPSWIYRCQNAVNNIHAMRKTADQRFEHDWAVAYASKTWWGKYWMGAEPNSDGYWSFYPSIKAWGDLEILERLLKDLDYLYRNIAIISYVWLNEIELGAIRRHDK